MLGGTEVRLCVTLRALGQLEAHFAVSGFAALAEALKSLSARDLDVVLRSVSLDDLTGLEIAASEAIHAVVAAFEALNGPE